MENPADAAALARLIKGSGNTVFFGGAGVSTESGIPDFRSARGIFSQSGEYPPEEIVSHAFFLSHPKEFYDFYTEKMIFPEAKPNAAHLGLARLEELGKVSAVVTQNIDGLHTVAGSKTVYELHGRVRSNYCMSCGKFYPLESILCGGVPHCECGGLIKPDVVLYGEALDDKTVAGAIAAISGADVLIIGGTSLNVYPASGLIRYFSGRSLVLINKTQTPADADADIVIREPIGEVFGKIMKEW